MLRQSSIPRTAAGAPLDRYGQAKPSVGRLCRSSWSSKQQLPCSFSGSRAGQLSGRMPHMGRLPATPPDGSSRHARTKTPEPTLTSIDGPVKSSDEIEITINTETQEPTSIKKQNPAEAVPISAIPVVPVDSSGKISAVPPTLPSPPGNAPPGFHKIQAGELSPSNDEAKAGPKAKGNSMMASLDPDALPEGFKGRRLLCFIGIVTAYTGLYFTRGTLTYSAPTLVADPAMNVSLKDIGAMTSAFPLAYGVSKFIGGVMGAKFSPTLMLGGGLAVTALLNLATTAPGIGVAALTAIWAANGCMQGIGAPASAALLTRWFASRERGTWWGLWNIGANIGGFCTPLVVGAVAKNYGWRYGMAIPGAAALVIALFALKVVKDSPAEAGYTTAEEGAAAEAKPAPAGNSEIWKALRQVMANPGCWLLAFTYFFVYVVRQGATSWLVFYLMAAKGAADAAAAAQTVSSLELGGLVGGTLAGVLSDMSIKHAVKEGKDAGHVGRRVQIVMGYVLATFGVLAALKAVPAEARMLQWLTIGALGFCIYGPQMLIGLCGAELVDKRAVGASQGFLGLVAYMGAANAGVPLSWVVTKYGWDGYFTAMGGAAAIALCLLIPLANAKSQLQLRAAPTPAPA